MQHLPITPPPDLRADLGILEIRTTIVDVPTLRQHKLSRLSVTAQSYVIVEVLLANGVTGIGEAATLGGPRWSEESVEGIQAVIDSYLAPAVIGLDASRFRAASAAMNAAAKRNNAAKAAIESALFDAVGRTLGVPAVQLLGGIVRERMPVYWTLASGDADQEIEEAAAKVDARLHDRFKVKIGAQPLADDLARLNRIAAALEGRATMIVDANQAWDETTANRAMPALAEFGVTLVEQPLPAWNVAGMARVRSRSAVPIMADECVFTSHDAFAIGQAAAADTLSLKLAKHGGLLDTRDTAATAEAAGMSLYGGCLLESSIGAAAHLHVFAALPTLAWGCEHFGPHILVEDLATDPLVIEDFHIHLPTGPGLGISLDPDKLRRFARR
jgi:muconate cycloisomerase